MLFMGYQCDQSKKQPVCCFLTLWLINTQLVSSEAHAIWKSAASWERGEEREEGEGGGGEG